jgi:hypothetical protein
MIQIVPLSRLTSRGWRLAGALGVLAVSATLIAAGASAGAPLRNTATCSDVVRFQGKLYLGTFVGRALHRGGGRVHAVRPGCEDTPGVNAPDVGVTLTHVARVSPSLALLATDEARHVYLVSGVFPENPDHPLHIALYGNRARPNECLGARAVGSLHFAGTVTDTPLAFNLLSVRSAAGVTRQLSVDAWSRLAYPYAHRLVKGSRVAVTAVRCLRPNTTAPLLVARRIGLRR